MESYLSAAEVAKMVGVHYRTVENWAAQDYLDRNEGKYGLISSFKYRISTLEEEVKSLKDNPKAELQLQKLTEEVSERRAIARIKNLEADLLEGKLIEAEQVAKIWGDQISKAKAKFIALPSKLALELSGIDKPEIIEEKLAIAINEALSELAD